MARVRYMVSCPNQSKNLERTLLLVIYHIYFHEFLSQNLEIDKIINNVDIFTLMVYFWDGYTFILLVLTPKFITILAHILKWLSKMIKRNLFVACRTGWSCDKKRHPSAHRHSIPVQNDLTMFFLWSLLLIQIIPSQVRGLPFNSFGEKPKASDCNQEGMKNEDSILFWIRIQTDKKYFSAIGSKPIDIKFRVVKSGATTHQVFHQKKHRKL